MSESVPDSWLVGVVATDEALSGLRVHGGYLAAGPASGRASRVQVRLRFGHEGEPVFPDADLAEQLLRTEEALLDAVGERAVFVAAVTVPGFRDLFLHTDDPDGCVEAASGAGFDEVDCFADPSWSAYRALFADAVVADGDRRRIQDEARRTGEGAPLCTVIHRFTFPGLAEADQAAAAMRDAGLTVTFVAADDVSESAPPSFTVTESEELTQLDMARSRDALGAFAASWEGRYDGWELHHPHP